MDFLPIIEKFGITAAGIIFLGWWLKSSLTDRISALETANAALLRKTDELNTYIRDDLVRIAEDSHAREHESHEREKELVRIIRDQKGGSHRNLDPQPSQAMSDDDTERIAVGRKQHRQDQHR